MSGDEHVPLCTTNEERACEYKSQEVEIIVFDGSKQGAFFGVLKLALNLDLYHFLRHGPLQQKLGTGGT